MTRSALAGYPAASGHYDELLDADGKVRPHYESLVEHFDRMGTEELRRRVETCRRLVHEQGIAYNVYDAIGSMERTWQLDPIPFIIGAEEWTELQKGLIQRARLINGILADCYGPQDLIASGWLPPALVFAQRDFLRPCHGIVTAENLYLHFYAVDLARSPDGRWWVVSDRTQIPTGAGYTLANRLVTSRILPECFRGCRVQRVAGFFREVQATLARLGSRRTDNPRVVVLTPGPYNETYFEQGYLARYLGYTLVQGQDLTVRDDRVYLKTLSGLEPVDVIVRRVDDDFCDPLELQNDSMLGVPGLLEATRAGNVVVVNSLGTGLLESPAFMAFLPGISRHMLGEELRLPSAATWWCGQKSAATYVNEHLDELIVKPAFRGPGKTIESGRKATEAQLTELRRQLKFAPHLFVGQEHVEYSTVPTWTPQGITPRPVLMRVYLVAGRDGYHVMPGGLVRVAPALGSSAVSMQSGGSSKDTWVLTEGEVDETTLLASASNEIDLRRVGNNLPSRLADNFYWLGRYTERSDATARLLRSTLLRFSPETTGNAMPLLEPLLEALTRQGQLPNLKESPGLRARAETLEAELLAAIYDPDHPGSLRGIAVQLQRLAILVRDRTSNDFWRVLGHLHERVARPATSLVMLAGDAVGVLNQVLINLAAFHGMARENMTRAQGWRFLDMGMRIERAIYLCTFLDASLRSPEADNPSVLESVLEVADSTLTYRSRYNLLPNLAAVYDLVLLDDANPRSLLFQLNQLVKHVERLPREKESALPSPAQRVLLECLTRIRLLDPRPLNRVKGKWHESEVGEAIQRVLKDLPQLSDAIAVSYFAHSSISRTGDTFR
ncbi:MAG TPA: circularly permuted type 2 ATP-grasp protein [Candidatus Limnocylindria bacterium]|nr:circularly permuted type 2 ATP-grasp protein [Candidatus Limnocylindria bacterium]